MLLRTITILLFTMLFISCSKDTNNPYGGGNPGIMSANIGGSLWYATTGNAQSPTLTTLNLNAYYNQTYITISITNYTGPGAYSLGGFNGAIFYDGNGGEYSATNGSLTVTSDNNSQVLGTFYFSGTSVNGGIPISVSNGQFNLTR